jgi:mutator protein MutT
MNLMNEPILLRKAAGVLIHDRRLLVERSAHKDVFVAPGGKLQPDETAEQAVIRELHEEFRITVQLTDLEVFGTFTAPAAGQEEKMVEMQVFRVHAWEGEPTPDNEVEEIRWITSANEEGLKLGSIFEHEVIPRLKAANLID